MTHTCSIPTSVTFVHTENDEYHNIRLKLPNINLKRKFLEWNGKVAERSKAHGSGERFKALKSSPCLERGVGSNPTLVKSSPFFHVGLLFFGACQASLAVLGVIFGYFFDLAVFRDLSNHPFCLAVFRGCDLGRLIDEGALLALADLIIAPFEVHPLT